MERAADKFYGARYVIVREGSHPQSAVLDRHLIEHMRARLPAQTKECVMETFGISANTWVKIKRGEPIRRSTADQLVKRLERLDR
ncbi:hypothetical protein [Sphingomonas oryzagri]